MRSRSSCSRCRVRPGGWAPGPRASARARRLWVGSCAFGAAALAWQRRGADGQAVRATTAATPGQLLAPRPGSFDALIWRPWWRGSLVPGGRSVVIGVVGAIALAVVWIRAPWPVVPGAAWALIFSAWLVALTERVQRAMEAHGDALSPWLASLPVSTAWRWRSRLLVCAPMTLAGLAAVVGVIASTAWRGPPVAAFAIGLVATPVALTAVPSAHREAHVGLWAICVGVLTALGSELWH